MFVSLLNELMSPSGGYLQLSFHNFSFFHEARVFEKLARLEENPYSSRMGVASEED